MNVTGRLSTIAAFTFISFSNAKMMQHQHGARVRFCLGLHPMLASHEAPNGFVLGAQFILQLCIIVYPILSSIPFQQLSTEKKLHIDWSRARGLWQLPQTAFLLQGWQLLVQRRKNVFRFFTQRDQDSWEFCIVLARSYFPPTFIFATYFCQSSRESPPTYTGSPADPD